MSDKVVALSEAVALVQPGDIIALGGMTLYRRPVAFVRELIRSGVKELTLLALTAGYESDLLVGAGSVRRVRTCYFGLEVFGLAPMFTKKARDLEIIEETEVSLALGLRAALSGIAFQPARAWQGTDLLRVRPDVKTISCPYTGERYVAFPAIKPDVAVIHAQESDRQGAAILKGNLALDREMALAAQRTIVTTERLVEEVEGEIGTFPSRVDGVVLAPKGAYPTSCYPYYRLASQEILDYVDACSRGGFEEYLARFLDGGEVGER